MPQQAGRRLATVLFLDIVGSTATAAELGDRRWRELLTRFRGVVRAELKRFGGREQDTTGDGFFATFTEPEQAIRGGSAIISGVQQAGLDVRIGIHTGGVETIDGGLGGIAVHIAARVMALADAAEILVTSTVRDLVAGSKIEFGEPSAYELKGVPGTWQISPVTSVDGNALAARLQATDAADRIAATPALVARARRRRLVRMSIPAMGVVAALAVVIGHSIVSGRTTTIIRIDPTTGRVLRSLHDGAYSQHLWGVLQAEQGSLWQATESELVRRDIVTGQIKGTIPLPGGLGSATGGAGSIFVTPSDEGQPTVITRFDETSGRQVGQLTLQETVSDLTFGDGDLWALATDGALTKIDPLSFQVLDTYLTTTSHPGQLVSLDGYVWICDCEAGRVVQFDPKTKQVVKILPLAEHGFLFGVGDTDGVTQVWLVDPGASTLTPINPITGQEGRSIGVPAQISDAEIARGAIWVSSPAEIRRIDLGTGGTSPPIEMPPGVSAGSIAVDPATGIIWVANCGCPKQQG